MDIKIGDKAPELVNAVIEIPAGSQVKYELDKETNMIKVDRFLYTAMNYPFNYGFIPETLEEDGDPVDIIVISSYPLIPNCYIEAKPIGIINMEDEEGQDKKIIAVPKEKVDPVYGTYNDIKDVPEILRKKLIHFFEHYKELEPNKWVKITGFDSRDKALEHIKARIKR
ncbi:MAG: inorganic pyrophosphatase [Candidatus Micrarchaeota archaeon]|nr:MAG: inorganic pyrophosphatase [Candidatus Micrarchaeota archaeon]